MKSDCLQTVHDNLQDTTEQRVVYLELRELINLTTRQAVQIATAFTYHTKPIKALKQELKYWEMSNNIEIKRYKNTILVRRKYFT